MKRLGVALVAIGVGFSPGIANAATALLVGGAGKYAVLTDEQMSTAFGGYFADYTRVNVPFPGTNDIGYSVSEGTKNLYAELVATYAALRETGDPVKITIGGVSEGGPVVDEVLRLLAKDPNRPLPTELDAVIYGDPGRVPNVWGSTVAGHTYQRPPDTWYDVTVVKAEYDGIADWPDNWFNLLAVVNAIMGISQLHVAKAYTDLDTVPTKNITIISNSAGGTTTTYLIPTAVLPLLKPALDAGWSPSFISALDSFLRPIIDSAYRRPVSNVPKQAAATLNVGLTAQTFADPPPDPPDQPQQKLRAGTVDVTDPTPSGAPDQTISVVKPLAKIDDEPPTSQDPPAVKVKRPISRTDMTDGNKVSPRHGFTTNSEDATAGRKRVHEPVGAKSGFAGKGRAKAREHAAVPGPTSDRARASTGDE